MTFTYDDYEKMEEEALNTELSDDFQFPTEAELPYLLNDKEGIFKIMLAYNNTPRDESHKAYRKALNQALYKGVDFVETEEDAEKANAELLINITKTEKIKEKVDHMSFTAEGFYPTNEEIDTYLNENTEENLAFLMWMVSVPDSELTDEQLKTKTYANWLINNRARTSGRKKKANG